MQVCATPYLSGQNGEFHAPAEVQCAQGTAEQGLTLVHFSAQHEPLLSLTE